MSTPLPPAPPHPPLLPFLWCISVIFMESTMPPPARSVPVILVSYSRDCFFFSCSREDCFFFFFSSYFSRLIFCRMTLRRLLCVFFSSFPVLLETGFVFVFWRLLRAFVLFFFSDVFFSFSFSFLGVLLGDWYYCCFRAFGRLFCFPYLCHSLRSGSTKRVIVRYFCVRLRAAR